MFPLFGRMITAAVVRTSGRSGPRWRVLTIFHADGTLSLYTVGGPDRPIPQPKPQPQQAKPLPTRRGSAHSTPGGRLSPSGSDSHTTVNSVQSGVSNLYQRLNNALAERGYDTLSYVFVGRLMCLFSRREMLGGLDESLQSLESGSKGMLAQASTWVDSQLDPQLTIFFTGKKPGSEAERQAMVPAFVKEHRPDNVGYRVKNNINCITTQPMSPLYPYM